MYTWHEVKAKLAQSRQGLQLAVEEEEEEDKCIGIDWHLHTMYFFLCLRLNATFITVALKVRGTCLRTRMGRPWHQNCILNKPFFFLYASRLTSWDSLLELLF